MKPSLRRQLVVNLLISIVVIISVTAVSIYSISSMEIETHIDAELVSSSLILEAVLGGSINDKKSLNRIQNNLDRMPQKHEAIVIQHTNFPHFDRQLPLNSDFQYQVWNKNSDLILHSYNSPQIPMSDGNPGFSNSYVGSNVWRVFTYKNPENNITIIVAENNRQRAILKNALATNNLIIMLITIPLLGTLIWYIVNKTLLKIRSITKEISQRAPRYLEEVHIQQIPIEIQPLIDELNKLFRRLEEAFEREQRFAADAAHELRTPMAAIKTQTQVAVHSQSEQELKGALQKILAGVDRSTHVVQQLLTLSRLNPGSSMDQHKAINLVAIAQEIISELIPLAIENDIEIELITNEEHIMLLGNPASIGILVRNLVDNAIRYSPEYGKVKVEISKTLENILLRISDNGPGIPEKLHHRVFERFFRVLGTQKPGSGLGLAIVHQIALLHDANLKLSKPAEGTGLIVEISFPNKLK